MKVRFMSATAQLVGAHLVVGGWLRVQSSRQIRRSCEDLKARFILEGLVLSSSFTGTAVSDLGYSLIGWSLGCMWVPDLTF